MYLPPAIHLDIAPTPNFTYSTVQVRREHEVPVNMRIGVHSGYILSGLIGIRSTIYPSVIMCIAIIEESFFFHFLFCNY